MKRQIIGVSLGVLLLAGCTQTTDDSNDAAVVATATVDAPVAAAPAAESAVPDDVEEGVDPSVWDNEGEPEGETPGEEITCEQAPLATYFFTLVGGNSVDNCGRADPKVAAAFDELMKEAAQGDTDDPTVASQRQRLLSGPSAPGVPLQVEGETWWYYTACQAHQCDTNRLVMLYEPKQSKLVGRLLSRCKIWWQGAPSAAQRELLNAQSPIDAAMLSDGEPCE